MTDIVLEREFTTPASADETQAAAEQAQAPGGCLNLFKVTWRRSFLSADGLRMVCWFDAPDAEFARRALRQLDTDVRILWPGTIHDATDPPVPLAAANVLVQRSFAAPIAFADVQALEAAGAQCLATHRVQFVRTYCARDGRRMVCLYRAPDAESVRLAQSQAGMPFDHVWPFQALVPLAAES